MAIVKQMYDFRNRSRMMIRPLAAVIYYETALLINISEFAMKRRR